MIALRQLKRVPKNHQIVIEVQESIHENQMMEVILLFKETPKNSRTDKLAQLQASQYDPLFMSDLQEINDDFDKTEMVDALSFQLGLQIDSPVVHLPLKSF